MAIRRIAFAFLSACIPAWAASCEGLVNAATKAEVITGGTFTPEGGAALTGLPPFCRVTATLTPSSDSEIRIELWMPQTGWNGRMEGTGNGGFAGKISYGVLASGLKRGYAVVNTDMGMSTPAGSDASIFTGRPERWADWGYRATHEMTVAAKQLVKAYYEKDPSRSYFVGCSTGGEQALMEAQRFPGDYDGIVGGAPANNRTRVHTNILWNFVVTHKDTAAYIPPAKLPMLTKAVNAACDGLDGLQDGIVNDPRKCKFDPATIQCKGSDGDNCLTKAQTEAVRQLYRGPANPRTGARLYPGLPRGSEFGWDRLGADPVKDSEPPYAPIFKWVFGNDWTWRTFDFDASMTAVDGKLAGAVNATDAHLDEFRRQGHKLLTYHGWADWLVVPEESINYHEQVTKAMGKTDNFYRLFMVPGMAHCSGGPGADGMDPLSAVVDWVEHDKAPEALVAKKAGAASFERLLCPYPQVANYRSGDKNLAASYVCGRAK